MHLFQERYKCNNLLVKIIKLTSYDRSFTNRPMSTKFKVSPNEYGCWSKNQTCLLDSGSDYDSNSDSSILITMEDPSQP